MSKLPRCRRPLIEALEPRLLFSATADIAVFDDGNADGVYLAYAAEQLDLLSVYSPADLPTMANQADDVELLTDIAPLATSSPITTVIFVDTAIDNYQTLVDDIRNNTDLNSTAIIYLDSGKNGIAQITDYLASASGISSIHVLSHGVAGSLQLGNQVLNENNIGQYAQQLTAWQTALGEEADILIYGCDLAANQSGLNFLQRLSELTGADVAASNDTTGNSRVGADWDLEARVGHIEAQVLFSAHEAMVWQGELANVTHLTTGAPADPTTTSDTVTTTMNPGQTFQLVSNATIDRIGLYMRADGTAAAQTITVELRQNSWTGTVLGSSSVASSSLSSSYGWVNFDFAEVNLTAYETYWIKITSTGTDGLVRTAYHQGSVFNEGIYVHNGSGDAGRDLAFMLVDHENTAPTGANNTVSTNEDTNYTFAAGDFGFSDVDVGDTISGVRIDTLPANGVLKLSGVAISAGAVISTANIPNLTFSPTANANGTNYTSFTFSVRDQSNAFDAAPNTMTLDVTSVNDAPAGADIAINMPDSTTYIIYAVSFGFTDPNDSPWNIHSGVRISSLPALGSLTVDGVAVSAGATISKADIDLGKLRYTPVVGQTGAGYSSFTFQVQDNGGTANGGVDLDQSPNTMTFNVVLANHAPSGINTALSTPEDTPLVFVAANFGFGDTDGNNFSGLKISSLPSVGTLTLNGGAVSVNQIIAIADINAGKLVFTPVANMNGTNYTSFTFQVQDDGGTANGGQNTDQSPNTMGIDVSYVNDAPVNTVPAGPIVVAEDTMIAITGVSVSDIDDYNLWDIEVVLTVAHGTLSVSGGSAVIVGSGTGSVTLTGTLAQVNATLGATLNYTPTNNYVGADTFTITTNDKGAGRTGDTDATDTDVVAITVTAVNDAPTVANVIPDQSTNEESLYSYTFPANTFNDVDGDTLTYTATLADNSPLPAWLSFNAATRTFSGVPDDGDVGVINIKVTANDGNGGTVADTFDLTVVNVNDLPLVNTPIPNQNATEDAAFTYTFPANTFKDGDIGNTFSYTAELAGGGVLPGWLSFDSATRTFSGTPLNGDVGTLSIKVIATDSAGATVSDNFDIAIANTNDAPTVANAIPNQTATENALYNYTFPINTFNDQDVGDILTYTAQLSGGAPLPAWLTFDAATRTFSGTPSNGDVGNITIEVIASDGTATVSDFFDLQVNNVGSTNFNYEESGAATNAQSLSSGTPLFQSFAHDSVGATYTIDSIILQIKKDPSASLQTITVSLISSTYNGAVVGSATKSSAGLNTALSWESFNFSGIALNDNQVYFIKVETTSFDGQVSVGIHNTNVYPNGAFHSSTGTPDPDRDLAFQVSSGINNNPNIANPIPNQSTAEDAAYNFQFAANTFSDADADPLIYSATMADGSALPAWLSFDAATRTFSGTPANADVGTISIKVTADDTKGGTPATDTFDLVITNTNDAPTVANAIPNQNATEDAAFNFTFAANTFADVDVGDTLTYSAQLAGGGALPAWLSFDAATRTFSGTPLNAHVGTVAIDVIASDGNGGTVTDTFDIVVANTNDAPTVANAIPNQNATEDTAFSFQFNANTFADVDVGDTLTYSAQLAGGGALPAWLSFNSATRTFSGTPTNAFVGTVSLDVIASDGNGGTVTDTFDIVVANTNDAPTVANAIPNQNATEDAAFNFTFAANTFADVDVGDTLTYSAQLAGGGALPAWLSFNSATRTFSGTPTNDFVGTVSLDVIASDGNGGTVTDTFDITVANTNDAPTVANAIPNQNATEDAAFSFQFNANTFADVDVGDTLTYSAQLAGGGALPAWLSFDAATRTFSGTPTNAFVGTVSLDVIASDGNGGTVTDTFDIVVANTNDAPTVANAIPDRSSADGVAFTFQFAANTFNDVDASDTLTYSALLNGGGGLPAWLSFDSATRTFSGVPATSDVGVLTIDVTADDGNGGVITDTFTLTVTDLPDTEYIDTGIGGGQIPVSSGNQIGQSFAFDSVGATYTVNEITLYLARYGDALPQTITVELRDAWGGAILGSDSISSTQISGDGFGWHSFNFANVALNDSQTYVIQISSSENDDKVLVSRTSGNNFVDGAMLENGVPDATGLDLAFKIAKDDGNNAAPVLDNPIADQALDAEVPFNLVVPANTFSDPDPNDTIRYRAQLAGGGSLGWLTFNENSKTFAGTPHWNQAGTMTVELIATDNHGASTSAFFDVVVTNTNVAPTVANAIPDQLVNEDSALSFQFAANTFDDVESNPLTYSAQLAVLGGMPSWLSFDAATRTFSGTPANADVGTWTIEVTANDGFGGSVIDTFVITVANTNDAPTNPNAIPDQTVAEDAAFNFQFAANTFADVDVGDTLTYSAQLAGGGALPAWLSFDSATRTFTGTPTNAFVGVVAIDVIANDGNGGTITDTFDITVTNTNDAPTVANAIPDQNATEDTAFSFQFAANAFDDVDVGATLTYSAQLAGGGALPAWLSFDSATRTFSGTPTNDFVGAVSIDVIANDGNGGTITDTFVITVTNTNDAPILANAIPNQSATEASAFSFQFAANTFNDIDVGNTLTYSAQLAGGGALPTWLSFDPVTRTFSGTPANAHVGAITLEVAANDGNGGTANTTFTVTVINSNDAPFVANAIATQTALEDAMFRFQFAATTFVDEDGDTLTYSAQLASGGALPSWLSFDSATRTFSGTPGNAQVGSIALAVTASDGNGGSVSTTFTLVVINTNDAPTLNNLLPDQQAIEKGVFRFTFAADTFIDVDEGDALHYAAQLSGGGALPAWLTFDAATRTFSGTPLAGDAGIISIDVIASDNDGSVARETFTLSVKEFNSNPTLANPIANQVATEDAEFRFQFATTTFVDTDLGDTLVYSAQLTGGAALPAWLTFDAATRTFNGTPTNDFVGSISIDVIASDGYGSPATDTFELVVLNTNDAPVQVNGIPNQTVIEDARFNFTFAANTFADVDLGDVLSYSAQLAGGGALPAWLTFNAITRTFSGTPTYEYVGNLPIEIIASDGQASVSAQFEIAIIERNDAPFTTGFAPIRNLEDAAGDVVDLWAAFSDEESPARDLIYTVIGNSNPTLVTSAAIDPATGKLQLHYGANQFGRAELIIRAQDPQGLWVEATQQIIIESVNDAPTTSGMADIKVNAGAAPRQIDLHGVFNDIENGTTLQWTLMGNSNGAVVTSVQMDPATGLMTLTFAAKNGGDSIVTLRAQDAEGAWVESSFKVTVIAAEVVVPPITPPVIPPVTPPTTTPPTTNPPVTEVPTTPPTTSPSNTVIIDVVPTAPGDTDSLFPNLGGLIQAGLIHDVDILERTDSTAVDGKSGRDFERATEFLAGDSVSGVVLNASSSLASLIAPDAGFTVWDEADFASEVRRIRAQMDDAMVEEQDQKAMIAGLTLSVTTGLLVWSLRASSLLLTMMSMLPLWRGIDPLPILEEVNKKKKQLEQQRKDKLREDKSSKEVGYLFDHNQHKES